jgi:hypothetical protein
MATLPAVANRVAYSQLALGFQTDRATAALPQTAQAAIFTVTGGRIAVLGIVGEVTTIIQTQANNLSVVANPTTGTDVALCAVLNVSADEVGCLYGITGVFADALVGANAGATILCDRPVIVPIGTIDLLTSASNTGSVKWKLLWLPVDDAATVAAA